LRRSSRTSSTSSTTRTPSARSRTRHRRRTARGPERGPQLLRAPHAREAFELRRRDHGVDFDRASRSERRSERC
jgi:hypothetical protein